MTQSPASITTIRESPDMTDTIIIKDAMLVNEGRQQRTDVLVAKGRIERLDSNISSPARATIIDAQKLLLLPGMIDDQVHFREPGLTQKGDLASESAAAVAGGITSFMEMPNTSPTTTTRQALADKYAMALNRCAANYAFYFGGSNDNIEEIRRLPAADACGIKVFMGASTGNMLVDDEEILDQIFAAAMIPVTTHCEHTPTILENLERATRRFGKDIPASAHPEIRNVEACLKSSQLAIKLAKKHGTKLHVLHLTTAEEMALFTAGDMCDKQITAEVCVHHLHFTADDYQQLGNQIKCNPAIKEARHREALIKAVVDGRIDIIATDHAPHLPAEKNTGNYISDAAGLPLAQHALPCAYELVHTGRISIERLVQMTAHNPAIRFQVSERGFIREGYFADLVLLQPDLAWTVHNDQCLSRCGWTPFAGQEFHGSIHTTMVNGQIVYSGNKIHNHTNGQRLIFDRH